MGGIVASSDLASVLGGRRKTAIDASLPPFAFVIAWALTGQSLMPGLIAAVAVTVPIAVWRFRTGERAGAVTISLLMVALGAAIAAHTGHSSDVFLIGVASNIASAVAWAVSIAIRWPLLGVVVGLVLGQKTRWRRDPALLRAYGRASWVWVGQYAIRTAVFLPLYFNDRAFELGIAQVLLRYPLVVACVAASWWVLKRALPQDHPGIRHPIADAAPEPATA
jgi:hypothetical protein